MKPEKINDYKIPVKKWGLYILISVWMFLLGVFVGRGMVTVKFGKEPNAEQTKEIYSMEGNSTKRNSKEDGITEKRDLEYYEALRSSDYNRFSDQKIIAISQLLQDANKTYDTNRTEKVEKSKAKKADKIEKSEGEKVDKKSEAQKNIYLVQAASFLSKQDSEKFIKVLKKIGYEAYVSSATKKGKVWYRVRIGPFNRKSEASKILRELEKSKINPIILTIKKG